MLKAALLLPTLLTLAISGCVSQPVKPVAGALEVIDDGFGSVVSVTSARYTEKWPNDAGTFSYFLMSTIERKTGSVTRGVVFRDTYNRNSWKFWRYAATNYGDDLQVKIADRKVNGCAKYAGCNYTESFMAIIPDAAIWKAGSSSISIKVGSQAAGSHTVTIAAQDLSAFLELEGATARGLMSK